MRVLGIDEAGRGCVLGDLFIGAFLAENPQEQALRDAGATDSKALSVKRRVAAREALASLGTADVRRVSPEQIDNGNLNTLEETVIRELIVEHRPDRVYIDALGHPRTLGPLVERLSAAISPLSPELIIEPKADLTYAIVGAASIFAKTERDDVLAELTSTWGELGSGYPSDPKTRSWLLKWAKTRKPWPHFVRTRWQTVSDLQQQALFS